jgi:hypothetical protein
MRGRQQTVSCLLRSNRTGHSDRERHG